MVMNLRVSWNVGKFLSSCTADGFLRRVQLHGVDLVSSVSHVVTSYPATFAAGSDVVPRSVSGRMHHLTGYFLSVVLFTSYSAALVSSIASRRATLPFRTFEEFLNNGHYRLGVVANSSIISNMRVRYIGSLVFFGP
jgi:hypothetical protein